MILLEPPARIQAQRTELHAQIAAREQTIRTGRLIVECWSRRIAESERELKRLRQELSLAEQGIPSECPQCSEPLQSPVEIRQGRCSEALANASAGCQYAHKARRMKGA